MSVRPKTTKIVWLAQGLPAMRVEATNSPPVQARSIVLWALIAVILTVPAMWIAAGQLLPRRWIIVASVPGPEPTARPSRTAAAERPAVSRGDSPRPEVPNPKPGETVSQGDSPRPEVPAPKSSEPTTSLRKFDQSLPTLAAACRPEPAQVVKPGPGAGGSRPSPGDVIALGRALFDRRWLPNDARCHGGDGLGPVFNATSCLECHSQGGPGGGGPARTNAELVTVVGEAARPPRRGRRSPASWNPGVEFRVSAFGGNQISPEEKAELVYLHPGFAETRSIVLHRSGVDPGYDVWRRRLSNALVAHRMETLTRPDKPPRAFHAGLIHHMALHMTQRNPTALYGAGLIDSLPAQALYEAAGQQPVEIRGRVAGRFGWKAQTATLHDFVLSACANELGLEVPGHHQGTSPLAPFVATRGLDLTEEECDALVAYVRNLPSPAVIDPSGLRESVDVGAGGRIFNGIGCAQCHTPSLGSVQGIYSDLLLHDMGESLSDPGTYYGSVESPGAASSTEWRTPPLWGVRASAPYLHDGRAQTLEDAVSLHGGQGLYSARRFFMLSPRERSQVRAFLNTLVAPTADEVVRDAADKGERLQADPTSADFARSAEARLRVGQSLEKTGKPDGAVNFFLEVGRQSADSSSTKVAAGQISPLTGSASDGVPAADAILIDSENILKPRTPLAPPLSKGPP
jgi:Di-haem oxidoreductase, putative peroxidase